MKTKLRLIYVGFACVNLILIIIITQVYHTFRRSERDDIMISSVPATKKFKTQDGIPLIQRKFVVDWTINTGYDYGKDSLKDLSTIDQSPVKYNFEMHANYRLKVLETEIKRLAQKEECSSVMANPLSYWRSQISSTTNFTSNIDLERLKIANKCTMIPIADFIKTPPTPTQYSFEIPYLEEPPVTNILLVTNESTSSVVLLNSSSTFYLGDTVALLVVMRDGNGNKKTKGGDEFRVWFTDVTNPHSVLATKITDFNNGTYLATTIAAFVGAFRATVTLVYSREYIQTMIIAHLMIKSTTVYLGAFVNSIANETTVCSHVPVIPGVGKYEVCDVSDVNGSPWFCGRPVKPWLKCTDYMYTSMLPTFMTMPMNEAEKLLLIRENKIFPITGSSDIHLKVVAKDGDSRLKLSEPSENCHTIKSRPTWEQPEPTGYLYQNIWHSYLCSQPETVTKACLSDLQVLILGDSNARAHFRVISANSECKHRIIQEYKSWHKPLHCVNKDINFSVKWLPHSNPFKTTEVSWAGLDWITASNKALDDIPSTGTYLILLNHYLHITSSHTSAYIQMMAAIKESLVRLFERNPNTFVVVQSPHVVWWFGARSSYHMGDTLRNVYTNIQYETFKDMRDRIFYIPTSEMTIATQNSATHPYLNAQITNFFTGYFCGRH